jgi:hypothetical protein
MRTHVGCDGKPRPDYVLLVTDNVTITRCIEPAHWSRRLGLGPSLERHPDCHDVAGPSHVLRPIGSRRVWAASMTTQTDELTGILSYNFPLFVCD